jgi:hypothetical protein
LCLAFVVLGVGLRLVRYLMNFPLWWDEAFVGVNLLRRGYFDLLRPLDYAQVCPLLFLWAELSAVKLLGFSEWSLRLVPLVSAIASVFLFRHMAGRVLRGLPLLMAVGIFAVSYHPIRHAADVKPYASDLLVGLILLALAIEWNRDRSRPAWLWGLAAFAPLALGFSHPAVFVAGGIGLALWPAVWRSGNRVVQLAHAVFLVSTAGSFLALYLLFTSAQASATLAGMSAQWATGFPPLGDPTALLLWLARVHTGSMFAYPCGGERGASMLTSVVFLVGAWLLWRRRTRTLLALCIVPFALALIAACLKRYPYGGVTHGSPARIMQFLAPAICLLAGLGAAALLDRIAFPARRSRAIRIGLAALVFIGAGPLAVESIHPYRSIQAERARAFARNFWPDLTRGGEPLCLRWDLGIGPWDSTDLNVAVYLCNQKIYAPSRRNEIGPRWDMISGDRPLRCVESLAKADDPKVARWLATMQRSHTLKLRRTILVDTAEPGGRPRHEDFVVYEFVPLASETMAREGPEPPQMR